MLNHYYHRYDPLYASVSVHIYKVLYNSNTYYEFDML